MIRTTDHLALPPGPSHAPSDITFRWFSRPDALLDECAADFGDTFTLRFARFGTHVVVSHPEDVRTVFGAAPAAALAGRGNAPLEPILGSSSLLLLDGDAHRKQRAVLLNAFGGDLAAKYAAGIAATTRQWLAAWSGEREVQMLPLALEISRDVILRTLLGVDDIQLARLSRLIESLMRWVATSATLHAESTDPRLLERFRAARQAVVDALRELVEARRRRSRDDGNLLSLLLAAWSESESRLTDDEICDQLVTLILAGHETTASSITWTLLCLADEPAAMRAVQAEIDAAHERSDESLAELPLLQAACCEALRLRPVIPVVSRELQAPLRLRAGEMPKGIFLTPSAHLAHRRPDVFADPLHYRPERFLEQRYSPFSYFPFGGGARRCIGMSFAMLEMQIVVGILLRELQFSVEPAAKRQAVRRAVTVVPPGGGKMYIERRGSR